MKNLYLSLQLLYPLLILISRTLASKSRVIHFDGPAHEYEKTVGTVDTSNSHSLIFAVRQRNVDVLARKLIQVSDRTSPSYGHYISSSDIALISANRRGFNVLKSFLLANGAVIEHETLHGEFITASAPISKWESFFSTKFESYKRIDREERIYRASHYTLHESIANHVMGVFNLIHFPTTTSGSIVTVRPESAMAYLNTITPSKLNSYYNIFTNNGSMDVTQTIYSSLNQSFSSTDLTDFQALFSIPPHPVDADPDNRDNPTVCNAKPGNCIDSSVGIQYITAIAQNTFTSVM